VAFASVHDAIDSAKGRLTSAAGAPEHGIVTLAAARGAVFAAVRDVVLPGFEHVGVRLDASARAACPQLTKGLVALHGACGAGWILPAFGRVSPHLYGFRKYERRHMCVP
jgi:hypothetical protein